MAGRCLQDPLRHMEPAPTGGDRPHSHAADTSTLSTCSSRIWLLVYYMVDYQVLARRRGTLRCAPPWQGAGVTSKQRGFIPA